MDTPGSPVHLVDNYTGFDTDTLLCCRDQVTPSSEGELWIAGNFMEVLEDVLPAALQPDYGKIVIKFEGCGSASFSYELFDPVVEGAISLQRIVNDNVPLCEALSAQQVGARQPWPGRTLRLTSCPTGSGRSLQCWSSASASCGCWNGAAC